MVDFVSIKIDKIKKQLGVNQALDGVSLNFTAGKMHGVIGPEGAGKTTLMRIILRLLHQDEGTIEFFHLGKILPFANIRSGIAYMPQQQSLYPELSVDEHLSFFAKLYQIDSNEYQKRRAELLEITRLEEFKDRPAEQLSGGMYKKLGLMCALLRAPSVMLLDEPTNGVDPISRREFWDLLYRLLAKGILIVVTTAYMDEAERCSEVHLLEAGKVIAAGEPRKLLLDQQVSSFDEIFFKHAGS